MEDSLSASVVLQRCMPTFCLRLSDDLAARFDAVAGTAGSRSQALRMLMERVAPEAPQDAERKERVGRGGKTKITIRLQPTELSEIATRAEARKLRRTQWVAALIRAHLSKSPPPPQPERHQLVSIRRELQRIGVNLNQAVHALHAAQMEGSRLDPEREAERTSEIARTTAREIKLHITGVGAALRGDLDYWRVDK